MTCLVGPWALLLFCATAAAADMRPPAQWLAEEKGLIEQRGRWMLPLEIAMQDRVRALPKLEADLLQSQNRAKQVAATLLESGAQIKTQIAALEARIESLRQGRAALRSEDRKKVIDAQMKRDREQLAKLRSIYVERDQLGGVPVLREALIDFTNRRNDLAAGILWIHDARPTLREQYDQLAADREVARAIGKLGPGHTLSSGSEYDAEPFLRRLAEYEKHVFSDELPMYRDHGELRVAGLIHRTPVTFTWHSGSEPMLLTASVIESAGLEIPGDAPRSQRAVADGRTLTVRQLEVPYLRFGRHVLTDVPAEVLPPEGENLGSQISPAVFSGLSAEAEPEKFRLILR